MAGAKVCSVEGCGRKPVARELCNAHRIRLRRYGTPTGGGQLRSDMQPVCSIPGCGQKREARGYCATHYANDRRRGDPMAGPTKAANGAHKAWVEANVGHQGDDCLTWPFDKSGYGAVRVGGRQEKAHRYMCLLAHGEPPAGKPHVAHSCGNGHLGCVNPRHLRWDSVKGNHADRYGHGTIYLGEDCWNAVLTEAGVRWARSVAGTMTYREMGNVLGVKAATVGHAVRRDTWAWLD